MNYEIDFIDGPADGQRLALANLPPTIYFPVPPEIDLSAGYEDFVVGAPSSMGFNFKKATYRRVADTQNYVYIRTE